MNVLTSDGKKLGSVERLVLDPKSRQIVEMIVSGGFLGHHRHIVDVGMIASHEVEELVLDMPEEAATKLPEFVETHYSTVPDDELHNVPFILPNAGGAGLYLYGAPYVGRGYEGSKDSFFDAAPVDPPIVENRTNVEENDVIISDGTDVVGADGHKVGTVEEVYLDDDGQLTGFLVKKGLIFTRDIRVPMDWVSEVDGDKIHLSVTAHEAEARAYDIEDTTL
ncbi:MAG: PRC-barrel domain-containing protein [Thermomicrobiales bacterium]|nr:PRC-barrel domain-containing protein [Thermomicrobiales bacterium]